jgi:predicted dehydrogenase
VSRVDIALVGLGRWAHAHAAAAARTDQVEIVSCFSRSTERRAAFAEEFGIDHTAATFDEILADPSVQAVVISTPNDVHVEMGLAAVEAGKPALIDKPVSIDLESGLELLRVAPDGRSIGIAHHPRRLAGHRAAQAWLASEESGRARLAHADFSNARGAHMAEDAWHRRVAGSEAGVLIQVGIHQVDNVLAALGPAVAVNARFAHEALGHMPDAAAVTIQHAGGAISVVTSSWTTPGHYLFEIQATGGNLRYTLDHGHWTSGDVDDHGTLILDRDGEEPVTLPTIKGDPLREQLDELAAVVGGSPMEVDVAAGLRAMAVVIGAVRSAATRGAEVAIADLLTEAGATQPEVTRLTEGE